MILRALSVRWPWSWAIVQGLKPWENRPRRFHYRGPLLIQASKTLIRADCVAACDFIERLSGRRPPAVPEIGGIVGAARLTDCTEPLEHDRGWRFAGEYGLHFENPLALPFRPMKGALGLFWVDLIKAEQRALRVAQQRVRLA
jgi:hypothetical protein